MSCPLRSVTHTADHPTRTEFCNDALSGTFGEEIQFFLLPRIELGFLETPASSLVTTSTELQEQTEY